MDIDLLGKVLLSGVFVLSLLLEEDVESMVNKTGKRGQLKVDG